MCITTSDLEAWHARVRESLERQRAIEKSNAEMPIEQKVQCLRIALSMTLGDISKLQKAFDEHHGEHHEHFAKHMHPDVAEQIANAISSHNFEAMAHPPMRNSMRAR